MSLLAIGVGYRSAPTRILEAASAGVSDPGKLLGELLDGEHLGEAVVLSTCNRVEVYADSDTFHGGVAEISTLLARVSGVPMEDLREFLYVHHEARAVAHLFGVAAGLDSMLVGEAQILGQLRSAFVRAQDEGAVGRSLGELFRQALRVGKRVRSETGIDRAGASLVGAALTVAGRRVHGLAGRSVLLVGAGATASLAGAFARREGAGDLAVVNRTPERGRRLAASLGGRAAGLDSLADELATADVVICATASAGVVVDSEAVERAVAGRADRPLVLIDLALPRDVDPAARAVPGVTLLDLDELSGVLAAVPASGDVEAASRIVAEEVGLFATRQEAQRVAPTVVALRAKAEELVASELHRLSGRLPDVSPEVAEEVARTVRRVVEKLLHTPTVRVKELAGSPDGRSYETALRELFDLDPRAVEAVSLPEDLPERET
jgi:glutamyl-tRNA reductase